MNLDLTIFWFAMNTGFGSVKLHYNTISTRVFSQKACLPYETLQIEVKEVFDPMVAHNLMVYKHTHS